MTLQRKPSESIFELYDKDEIIEYQLPKWNSNKTFKQAWNTILIQVQGSYQIFENTNEFERNKLYDTLRYIKGSYYDYSLKEHTSVLITSQGRPLIRIHLKDDWIGLHQKWAKVDLKDTIKVDKKNHASCLNKMLFCSVFTTIFVWSLLFQMV